MMASQRRVKVFGVLTFLVVVTILFWTSSLRREHADDFYIRTVQALDQQPELLEPLVPKSEDAKEATRQMAERLNEAARVAKSNANAKAPKPDSPRNLVGVGNAADATWERRRPGSQDQSREETEEDHEVEAELNSILKRSPIIIFSKSYCPHSRRAKDILLEKYIIDPAPFVVELDQHPLGANLQARLAELTGRRTVPNVLINGISIGGGDDIADLDERDVLIDKVRELGGKRMTEVRERPGEADDHGLR